MLKIVNIYLLSSHWVHSHRKIFIHNISKRLGKTIVIQDPVSLSVNLFHKFKERFYSLISGKLKPFSINENIQIFTPFVLFHRIIWNKCKLIAMFDAKLLSYQINKFIKKYYQDYKINFWIYLPLNFYLIKHIKYDNLIYDYYDDYEFDTNGDEIISNIKLNRKLVPLCDLIICISEFTTNRMLKLNKRSIITVSGYDTKIFSKDIADKITEIDNLDKPIIGYSGVLRSYIDFSLLEYLLKNTEYYLVCIGYIDRTFKEEYKILKQYKNFIHIEYKPIEEIPYYVKKFNVGILPYKENNFTKSVFPLKFFEYMAMEIPIVSTALPELEKYKEIIGYSKTKEEFLENCKNAINGFYNSKFSEYPQIIAENSWDKVFDKIEENLIEVYKEKGII